MVKKAYFAYFDVKLGSQDRYWAPYIVCKTGFETFWSYMNGMQTMNLGILII